MTPEQLSAAIVDVLTTLSDQGAITLPDGVPASVTVERPRQKGHGDYATNVALQLAKKAGTNPRALAGLVQGRLAAVDGVADVEIAGPGFLNISASRRRPGSGCRAGRRRRRGLRATDAFAGETINLEFVSANPTGPIHIGGTRWAAVGDALGRLLSTQGARVTREYYFNDHGTQIDRFAGRCWPRPRASRPPRTATAATTSRTSPRGCSRPEAATPDPPGGLPGAGVELMFAEIKQSLARLRRRVRRLLPRGRAAQVRRRRAGRHPAARARHVYEQDGAVWLATERFGDDKDRVVIKSDGQGAYLSGDLAYYLDKRERGFDRCLIMLGADHHGYVGRMNAMCAAFGDTPGTNLEILIGQMVNLVRDGQPLRMSKRAGTVVTIDDLVGAIGVDAARYALARYSSDSNIDLDLDLWSRADSDNPVYYVQYAHARISSILRNAADLGFAGPGSVPEDFDPALLSHEKEGELLRALAEFPRVVASAAELREPHRVARYLEDTAGVYHRFYDNCRVLPMGDEEPNDLHRARLVLVAATRTVLANGLRLLGVSAPERM